MKKHILFSLLIGLIGLSKASAQSNVGIKTNLLYGAYTYTPNLGIEIGLSRHATLDISGGYNPWNLNSEGGKKKLVHYLLQPEFRYYTRNRFNGHFFGVHTLFSQYNIGGHELPLLFGKGSKEYRHEGVAYGGGISYGYQFSLGRFWNVELSLGAGIMQMSYDKYDCINCGQKLSAEKKTYFGPTKAAVSLIYILGKRKDKRAREKQTSTLNDIERKHIQSEAVNVRSDTPLTEQSTLLSKDTIVPNKIIASNDTVPAPYYSVADSLANHFSFLAPSSEFGQGNKSKEAKLFNLDMALNMNTESLSSSQNPDERFVAENEEGAILIHFSRSATIIDRYYQENNTSLVTLASVLKMIQVSDDSRVSKIVVAGFASPEGLLSENERLAQKRAFAVRNFILANSTVHADSIYLYNGSEDWRGLRKLVAASDMEAKNEILRIIDNVPIKAGREKRLMDLAGGAPYRWMALHFFPKLRNAAYIKVYYTDK